MEINIGELFGGEDYKKSREARAQREFESETRAVEWTNEQIRLILASMHVNKLPKEQIVDEFGAMALMFLGRVTAMSMMADPSVTFSIVEMVEKAVKTTAEMIFTNLVREMATSGNSLGFDDADDNNHHQSIEFWMELHQFTVAYLEKRRQKLIDIGLVKPNAD